MFAGGEESSQTRSWKVRTVMSSMHKELATVMRRAEMGGDMDVTRTLVPRCTGQVHGI